ncbi:hypothetical protein A2875_02985 [Candidatus Gottesmanbacteria bacterium RIFCSPHIGHO2_01_FULL_46_14]|uniref:3-ketoacyl-ACP reductase n=2 Tax=Candidatus Gottesmaniibacteriota TaxID=1752720 RepID=A0A1F5ZQX3_9BACT|nr:MAG: hypothetical protein A2875_02985 [Candidatus Gottesmanbacteria bacterium RIFCSPHIGHO2_01_FULL_46_14]OGG30322.1 MAG: hypothetical protein A2971_01875 [Candidatus Gottesmanbacteria bacterium RIFCSPLOWO2_01_FULL_46_21]
MELKDKVVLITGSSSGIGKAAALKFAQEKAKVVVHYKTNKTGAQLTVDEMKNWGAEVIAVQADVVKPHEVKRLFSEVLKAFGTLDVLINNAGLAKPKPFLEITRDDLAEEFDKNFFSMVYSCQEAARIMQKKDSGKIINVSSICGLTGCTSILTFTSARSAVTGFTKALAKILAPNIMVNAVAPGFTLTRFWDKMTDKEVKELLDSTLSKKWVTAEEIADTFIYLTKNDSVTGQVIVVDGGYTTNI